MAAEATPVDVDGENFSLPTDGEVRIAHPFYLKPEERQAWQEYLDRQGVEPPFEQLERDVVDDGEALELPRLLVDLPRLNPASLMNRLRNAGFEAGRRQDAGLIYDASKAIGPYLFTVTHEGYETTIAKDMSDIGIEGVDLRRAGEPMEFDHLPGHLKSEVVRDLLRLTEQ